MTVLLITFRKDIQRLVHFQFAALIILASLIDGTVEGTNVSAYADPLRWHDHTYYGNGCSNVWDSSNPPTYGGSITACSTRITETSDNENQKIGTYYNYHSVTAGTAEDHNIDNEVINDSVCPLGWQLPYGGTGGDYYDKSKSWKYLYDQYSITNDSSGSATIRSYPFSNVYSGYFYVVQGVLFNQGAGGTLWTPTIYNANIAYRVKWFNNETANNVTESRLIGMPIRCVTRK